MEFAIDIDLAIRTVVGIVAFAVVAPIVGCLLAGLERKISAHMQGRVGPPILQPFYDVRKLMGKERASVNASEGAYVTLALVFAIIAGGIFFSGGNLLLCIFVVTMASMLFIAAAYSSRSPYSEIGAARETLQVLSYEPMVLLVAVAFYLATGTFDIGAAVGGARPAIVLAWPAFIGLLFVLTIKLRKSPFDISMAEHAHQEIVRGMTTEMSGPTLAIVEVMHWCESVLFLGWVGMFFLSGGPLSIVVAVVAGLIAWFLEIWIDNNFARVKWQAMVASSWIVALVAGGGSVIALTLL